MAERLAGGHLGGDYDQKVDCTFEEKVMPEHDAS